MVGNFEITSKARNESENQEQEERQMVPGVSSRRSLTVSLRFLRDRTVSNILAQGTGLTLSFKSQFYFSIGEHGVEFQPAAHRFNEVFERAEVHIRALFQL